MAKDRFAARNARDKVMKPSDRAWEGGIIRTFLIQFEHSGLVCTECRMELREGHTAAVYLNRDGLRTYRHLMPDECQSLANIRESRRLAREERQLELNQETYKTMPSTNDPSLFSGFKHRDGLFVIKLADLCGWRITILHNGMGVAYAEDGTEIKIPSNTGLRNDVFRSWTSKVWTHTDRKNRPSPLELLRLMVDVKLEPSARKVAWKVFGVQVPTEPKDTRAESITQEEWLAANQPPIPVQGEAPYIVTEEPLLVKPGSLGEHRSTAVIERKWSNGDVDYACSVCGIVKPTPPGITAHFKLHVNERRRAAETELNRLRAIEAQSGALTAAALAKEAAASVALDGETQSIPAPSDNGWTADETAIADLVISLIRQAAAAGSAPVAELKRQLAEAEARAAKAEGDLDALRDLLGVRK